MSPLALGLPLLTDSRWLRMVNDLDGKMKVMELMSHESGDVKYQALITVSHLLDSRENRYLISAASGSAHNVALVDFLDKTLP